MRSNGFEILWPWSTSEADLIYNGDTISATRWFQASRDMWSPFITKPDQRVINAVTYVSYKIVDMVEQDTPVVMVVVGRDLQTLQSIARVFGISFAMSVPINQHNEFQPDYRGLDGRFARPMIITTEQVHGWLTGKGNMDKSEHDFRDTNRDNITLMYQRCILIWEGLETGVSGMRGLEGALLAIVKKRMQKRRITIFTMCEPTGSAEACKDHVTKWFGTTFASLLDSAGEWALLKYKVDRSGQKAVVEV